MLNRRNLVAYTILLAGATLFMLRRLILPTMFDIEGVPFDIAAASAINSCYFNPALNTCSDGVIIVLTILGVTLASGWASAGRMIFAVILMLLPLALYLLLVPIWVILGLLIALPLALEIGVRLFMPA